MVGDGGLSRPWAPRTPSRWPLGKTAGRSTLEIEPVSESCFDLTMTESCGSILGPYFCMMTCWATFCVYSSSWLYTGGCLGPACLEA